MSDRTKAKKLFFEFYGNEFFMWKDGFLDEYKTYNIPKEQELIWKSELKEKLYCELQIKHGSSFNGLHILMNYFGDYDLLDKLLDYISINYKKADSFLKIRYAEDFFDILKNCKFHDHCPEQSMTKTRDLIIFLLNDVLNNEIKIDKESEKILEFNTKQSNSDYLIVRTKSLLKRVEEFQV